MAFPNATPGAAALVEYDFGGHGFVVRGKDGRTLKCAELDGYGYERLRVFDDYESAYAAAVAVISAPECPECGSDDIERVQGGALECTVCGHGFQA